MFNSIPHYSASCTKYSIDKPSNVRFRFIFCKKLSEYLDLCQILTRNNTSVPFFSSFATLVFIDYAANSKIQEVRESTAKMIPKRLNTGFVYFNATEDLMSYHTEDTHIFFEVIRQKV